jgi:uncharacterized protein (TIGR00255 family)
MTGYGRAERAGPRVTLTVEAKSLNHRFLDIALKLPRSLAPLEPEARRIIQAAVQRGRVEVAVGLAPADGLEPAPLTVNLEAARAYADAARRVGREVGADDGPPLAWVLDQPGVLAREDQPEWAPEAAGPDLAQALDQALARLVERRAAEGRALARELGLLQAALETQIAVMAARAPAAVERRTERLRERLRALLGDVSVDESRIVTEAAVWADKTDIAEEVARLRAHVEQFARQVQAGGPVGRTLDFLIQEMNREVNTAASKADDLELSQAAIAAKSALEKLREQVQNIE